MTNRGQQLRVNTGQSSQSARIEPVVFARTFGNESHPASIGHDDFVIKALQQSHHPARVRPDFEGDSTRA